MSLRRRSLPSSRSTTQPQQESPCNSTGSWPTNLVRELPSFPVVQNALLRKGVVHFAFGHSASEAEIRPNTDNCAAFLPSSAGTSLAKADFLGTTEPPSGSRS